MIVRDWFWAVMFLVGEIWAFGFQVPRQNHFIDARPQHCGYIAVVRRAFNFRQLALLFLYFTFRITRR